MQSIKTDEKTGIIYREWEAGSPKALLLLVHGLGAHSGRWEFLADFFLRNDISSYAIELKGFGQTKTFKGHIDSFDIYLDDIRRLCDIIRERGIKKRIFLIGESMGAVIAFLEAIARPDLFDGLICISPAFRSSLKFTPLDYIKIFLPLFYNPKKEIDMPFTSAMCTRDVEYQKAMDASELEHRFATAKLLGNMAIAQVRAAISKGRLTAPVLFLLAGMDKLVDPRVSKRIFEGMRAQDKELIEYPKMYHALSIDVGRERVFSDMLKWLEKRI